MVEDIELTDTLFNCFCSEPTRFEDGPAEEKTILESKCLNRNQDERYGVEALIPLVAALVSSISKSLIQRFTTFQKFHFISDEIAS